MLASKMYFKTWWCLLAVLLWLYGIFFSRRLSVRDAECWFDACRDVEVTGITLVADCEVDGRRAPFASCCEKQRIDNSWTLDSRSCSFIESGWSKMGSTFLSVQHERKNRWLGGNSKQHFSAGAPPPSTCNSGKVLKVGYSDFQSINLSILKVIGKMGRGPFQMISTQPPHIGLHRAICGWYRFISPIYRWYVLLPEHSATFPCLLVVMRWGWC